MNDKNGAVYVVNSFSTPQSNLNESLVKVVVEPYKCNVSEKSFLLKVCSSVSKSLFLSAFSTRNYPLGYEKISLRQCIPIYIYKKNMKIIILKNKMKFKKFFHSKMKNLNFIRKLEMNNENYNSNI